MKNTITILGAILLISSIKVYSQDIHFSQFFQNSGQLNPSLCGSFNGLGRFSTNYKSQWKSIDNTYSTFAFNADGGFFKTYTSKGKGNFLGLGLNFFTDRAGELKLRTTSVLFNIAYNLKVGRGQTLAAGIQAGFIQRSIDPTNGKWGIQYDGNSYNPDYPSGEFISNATKYVADFGMGMTYTWTSDEKNPSRNWTVLFGAGAFHVNQPNQTLFSTGEDRLHLKINPHLKINIPLNKKDFLIPQMMYSSQGSSKELIVGFDFRHFLSSDAKYTGFIKESAIYGSAYFRNSDAIIIGGGYMYSGFQAGLSYDINISKLSLASRYQGGLEASLIYIIRGTPRVRIQSRPSFE